MIGDLLKSIFGDKTAKDRKEYWPFVDKANTAWESVKNLSDDQLRDKTRGFQEQVRNAIAELEATLDDLQAKAADLQTSFEEKEKLYEQIDQMVKSIDERIEEELLVILPEAFAVVKETARRFKENTTLTVTATSKDR
jgi:preprotein translocase subunit SecA